AGLAGQDDEAPIPTKQWRSGIAIPAANAEPITADQICCASLEVLHDNIPGGACRIRRLISDQPAIAAERRAVTISANEDAGGAVEGNEMSIGTDDGRRREVRARGCSVKADAYHFIAARLQVAPDDALTEFPREEIRHDRSKHQICTVGADCWFGTDPTDASR